MAQKMTPSRLPKVIYGGGLAYFVVKAKGKSVKIEASKLKISVKLDQKAVYTSGSLPSLVVDGKTEIELEFSDMMVHEIPYARLIEQMKDDYDMTISVWAFAEKKGTFLEAMRFYGCASVDIDTTFTINEPAEQSWKLKAFRGFEIISPQLIEESPAFH